MEKAISADFSANFRWQLNIAESPILTLSDLKNSDVVEEHLTMLTARFDSFTRAHAASIVAKRVGYAAALLIYARLKHGLKVDPSECVLMTPDEITAAPDWMPIYSFKLESMDTQQTSADRIIKKLYAETVIPIIETLVDAKGISRAVLLENVFVYVKWVLLTKLKDDQLFQQLIAAPSCDFGCGKRHPFAYYECASGASRRTCCLRYQTLEDQRTCKTCPLNKRGL